MDPDDLVPSGKFGLLDVTPLDGEDTGEYELVTRDYEVPEGFISISETGSIFGSLSFDEEVFDNFGFEAEAGDAVQTGITFDANVDENGDVVGEMDIVERINGGGTASTIDPTALTGTISESGELSIGHEPFPDSEGNISSSYEEIFSIQIELRQLARPPLG